MLSDTTLQMGLLGSDSEKTYYREVPYRCAIRTVRATAALSDIGDADTVKVYSGTTLVGTATFGSTISAGAVATYVADTTNGDTVFSSGGVVKVVVSALDASDDRVYVDIELDPSASGS